MSKNTSFIPLFSFNFADRLAVALLCVSSSLVFSNISWAQKPTQEEIANLIPLLSLSADDNLQSLWLKDFAIRIAK